jgi:hypothetical protein
MVRGAGWPIDPHTTQAFQSLRVHAEELALELAVRLRVLGKSLAAGCQGRGESTEYRTAAYKSLRLNLENFISSLVEHGIAEHHYSPVVRYLQDSLPFELAGCPGQACRVGQVETVISLLSESVGENDDFSGALAPSISF